MAVPAGSTMTAAGIGFQSPLASRILKTYLSRTPSVGTAPTRPANTSQPIGPARPTTVVGTSSAPVAPATTPQQESGGVAPNLPFKYDYANAAAQLLASKKAYHNNLDFLTHQLDDTFQQGIHRLGVNQFDDKTGNYGLDPMGYEAQARIGILNNHAARGGAFSTGYARDLGNEVNSFQNALQQAAAQRLAGDANYAQQGGAYDDAFTAHDALLTQAAAQNIAPDAGTLNLVPPDINVADPNIISNILLGLLNGTPGRR